MAKTLARMRAELGLLAFAASTAIVAVSCSGPEGDEGPAGAAGSPGPTGTAGLPGANASGMVWRTATGQTPGRIATSPVLGWVYAFDDDGNVWLAATGVPGEIRPVVFVNVYYENADCSGAAYLVSGGSSLVQFTHTPRLVLGLPGPEYRVVPDGGLAADSESVLSYRVNAAGLPGICQTNAETIVGVPVTSLTTVSAPATPWFTSPIHPEFQQ